MNVSPSRALSVDRARENLRAADARIDGACERRSLAPGRGRATSLITIYERLMRDQPEPLRVAFAAGLRRCALAQLSAFPENVFWDLDAIAGAVARAGRRGGAPAIAERSAIIAALQELFGQGSPIRFRYVHDFVYGYDWTKWVRRRGGHGGPFEMPFLRYSWRRGHELLQLIARDDETYPKLPDGTPRNPFAFSREPADEERILRALAERDELPLRAWESAPLASADRDYYVLREACAKRLEGARG